jgi:hypothetical protein
MVRSICANHMYSLAGSPEGEVLQNKMVAACKAAGARLIGPNCVGVADPSTGVNTVFLDQSNLTLPSKGPIGLLSQSGGVGVALLNTLSTAYESDKWLSKFFSLGNGALMLSVILLLAFDTLPNPRPSSQQAKSPRLMHWSTWPTIPTPSKYGHTSKAVRTRYEEVWHA